MASNSEEKWGQCLAIIKDNIGEQAYKSWFAPITVYGFEENTLTL